MLASWDFLQASWGLSWTTLGHLGAIILGPRGLFWGYLGACHPLISALGPIWGPLGALLGRSWVSSEPDWSPSGLLLELSWRHLEASGAHRKRKGQKAKLTESIMLLTDFGLLGVSWGPLGVVLDHLGPP